MPNNIQLQVADPCHENWNAMTAVEQGRYCQSCQKTVTDFSMMTDKEILNHLSKRDADLCGRFTADQLDRTLIGEPKKKFSWAYVWNFVIATFLSTGFANAQTSSLKQKKKELTYKPAIVRGDIYLSKSGINASNVWEQTLVGQVLDSKTNQPLPFAAIGFKNTLTQTVADVNGKFKIESGSDEIIIVISAVGYAEQEYTISKNSSNSMTFYLDLKPAFALGPEMSMAKVETCLIVVAGGMVSYREVSIVEKTERRIIDLIPEVIRKKEMTIYPNPQIAGGSVNISVALKDAGDYSMEILDEQGRIVYRKQVEMHSKKETVSVTTNALWSKGVYWVRLTGNDSKKTVHSKFMLR